jgi:hypothetical protein
MRHIAAGCVFALIALTEAEVHGEPPQCGTPLTDQRFTLEDVKMVWAHNVARQEYGLEPFVLSSTLTTIAREHVRDFVEHWVEGDQGYDSYFQSLYDGPPVNPDYLRYRDIYSGANESDTKCGLHSWSKGCSSGNDPEHLGARRVTSQKVVARGPQLRWEEVQRPSHRRSAQCHCAG